MDESWIAQFCKKQKQIVQKLLQKKWFKNKRMLWKAIQIIPLSNIFIA